MALMKRLNIYIPQEMDLKMELYKRDFGTAKTEFIRQAIRHYFAYLSDGDRKGVIPEK